MDFCITLNYIKDFNRSRIHCNVLREAKRVYTGQFPGFLSRQFQLTYPCCFLLSCNFKYFLHCESHHLLSVVDCMHVLYVPSAHTYIHSSIPSFIHW